jgi:hypothetical protein
MLMAPGMHTGRVHMGPAPLQSLCLKLSRGVLTMFRACRTTRTLHGRAPQHGVHKGGDEWGVPQVRDHCWATTKLGAEQLHGGTSLPSKFGAGPTSPTTKGLVSRTEMGWCPERHLGMHWFGGRGGDPLGGDTPHSRPSTFHGQACRVSPGWGSVGGVGRHGLKAYSYINLKRILVLAISPKRLGFRVLCRYPRNQFFTRNPTV